VCVCYSHKLQLQNNKLKKTKEKRHTTGQKHNLSSAYYICTTEAQGNINIGNRRHDNAHYLTAKTFNLAKATAVAGGTFSDTGRVSSRQQCSLPGVINANALESVLCISALEVFLNDMRYINPRFTYLLTYLNCLLCRLYCCSFAVIKQATEPRSCDNSRVSAII